jgi:hypothetical protein
LGLGIWKNNIYGEYSEIDEGENLRLQPKNKSLGLDSINKCCLIWDCRVKI